MKSKFLPALRASSRCLHNLRTVPVVMLLALPLYSHALPSDANQQIKLLADKATYSERTGDACTLTISSFIR